MPKKSHTSSAKTRKVAAKKTPTQTKARAVKKQTASKATRGKAAWLQDAWRHTKNWILARTSAVSARRARYLLRRPHRSFQLTRRRDYTRSLKVPGYFAFTFEVGGMLWRHKWTFLLLCATFLFLTVAFGLLGSEDTYSQIQELLSVTQPDGLFQGAIGEVGKAGLVLLSVTTSGLSGQLTEAQKIAASFFSLYVWLTVVWLLRNIMTGKRIKLRDGLYNAGAPILPTFLLFLVLLIQLVPMALVIIVASAGWQSGFIQEGAASMAAGLGLTLVVVASLYWVVSTFFALVIVTLPGMYPFRALTIAGDLVIGRRLRLVYRIVWLFLTIISWWVVIMIPIILLDSFLKSKFEQIVWMPVVPMFALIMTTFTIVWTASYVYLLYRKVVDDDAGPA